MDNIEISISEIENLLSNLLKETSLSESEVRVIVEDYIDAELRGKVSHGLSAFKTVLDDAKNRSSKFQRKQISNNIILYDGNGDIGHLIAEDAIKYAASNISEQKIVITGMRDMTRFATPGTIAFKAAKHGLISLVFEYGGQAFMAPYGGTKAALSTNPIGIGIPYDKEPIVLDMASSERAFYFISLAAKLGKNIPEGWGINEAGEITIDPSEVKAVLPFGGYKGSGLAFMLEILTGPLLGVDVGNEGIITKRGALCFFINPETFEIPQTEFKKRIKNLIEDVKKTAPAEEKVYIPGEQALQRKSQALESGSITIPQEIYEDLKSLT